MSDWEDKLAARVADNLDDIIFDRITSEKPSAFTVKTKEFRTLDTGTDDGGVYGTYEVIVNGGEYVLTIKASAAFQGFQDCWDWSGDSHYTKDVTFDELVDYEHEVEVKDGQKAVDNVGDQELNSREEK